MKKYTFLVFHREYQEFLNKLQQLGVIHVIEKATGEQLSQELHDQYRLSQEYTQTIKLLERRKIEKSDVPAEETDGETVLKSIQSLTAELEQISQQLTTLRKEIAGAEPWGQFDWSTIRSLAASGIHIRFFNSSMKKFEELSGSDLHFELINSQGGMAYFILLDDTAEKKSVDADEVTLPEKTLLELKEDEQRLQDSVDTIHKTLDNYAATAIPLLMGSRSALLSRISFRKVELNTQREADDSLMILEGWVPEDKQEETDWFLDNEAVYHEISDPGKDDKIPIKLANSKFFKLFEPIGDLYSLPNYNELDLTPLFAPFFLLFFGLCLGDTGYGIVLLLIATLAKLKVRKTDSLRPYLTLGQWLGFSTILMGMVSGTFFGINLLDTGYLLTQDSITYLRTLAVPSDIIEKAGNLTGMHFNKQGDYLSAVAKQIGEANLKDYRMEFLRSAFSDFSFLNYFRHLMLDSNQMFLLAIIIGLVQIFFGMCVKAFNIIYHRGFKYALSTIGWILLFTGVVGWFFLSKNGIIPEEFKKAVLIVIICVSGFLILVFSDPDTNPLISSLKGIWDVYGMLSGIFGDTLSYIRLFALGTSSAILGLVFNIIGMQILDIAYAGPVLFVIFMLFGHGLNIAMATLGAFVHPVRLTFVEFYKNAGFSGGGKAYQPFK